MDVQKKLDDIVVAVEGARSMPMSASCVVNRGELLTRLDEVRAALPDSLSQAQQVLGGREQVVEEARQEANRIIESARTERESLIGETAVARLAQEEADRILAEARHEADEVRAEADDYVDSKLANFEVVLTKTIGSVERGREKLLGRGPGPDGQGFEGDDAPERSTDPETLRRRADEYVDAKFGAFEGVLAKTLEAVGRGRLKLTGHGAADDLGAHLAQDAAAFAAGQTDAEFLAGLADPVALPQRGQSQPYEPARQIQQSQEEPYEPARQFPPVQQPQPPYEPVQQPQSDQFQQAGYQEYDNSGYVYQQDYAQQPQQPPYGDQYGQQQEYGQQQGYQQDAAAYGWQQQGYEQQGYVPQQPQEFPQPQPQPHPQSGSLDETSFFDTGMIDLDRLRELEQGR